MGRIEKDIVVMAPVDRCYQVWSNFEAFPRFMENVKEIRPKGEAGMWHWIVAGPVGDVEFDVEVDALKTNQLVSWHTVRDADVSHSGAVRFEQLGAQQTRVHVAMEYQPPAGKVGEFVADILKNPKSMVEEDLNRFKMLVEQQEPMGTTRPYTSTTKATEGPIYL